MLSILSLGEWSGQCVPPLSTERKGFPASQTRNLAISVLVLYSAAGPERAKTQCRMPSDNTSQGHSQESAFPDAPGQGRCESTIWIIYPKPFDTRVEGDTRDNLERRKKQRGIYRVSSFGSLAGRPPPLSIPHVPV